MLSLSKRQLSGLSKRIFPTLRTLALTVILLWSAPAVATPLHTTESQERERLNERLRDVMVEHPMPPLDVGIIQIFGYQERDLLERLEAMEVSLGGRTWVEQAPKTWPYPMVISPGRPVLPGSVW